MAIVLTKLEFEKPICVNSGGWDGLRSDLLLLQTMSGNYHIGYMYKDHNGIWFYDQNDFEVDYVKYWTEI